MDSWIPDILVGGNAIQIDCVVDWMRKERRMDEVKEAQLSKYSESESESESDIQLRKKLETIYLNDLTKLRMNRSFGRDHTCASDRPRLIRFVHLCSIEEGSR